MRRRISNKELTLAAKEETDGTSQDVDVVPVAENGLLHRRSFLRKGLTFAGASTALVAGVQGAKAEALTEPPWSLKSGDAMPPYQLPSKFAAKVVRTNSNPNNLPKVTQTRTPHQFMEGQITPNGLHFAICHAGVPEIDPDQHRLVIHGLVKQPLIFTMDQLLRYPMESHIHFIECGGNSVPLFSPEPMQATVQDIHGLVSTAEWTGVRLSTLLDEAGIDPRATWIVVEGGDAPHLDRSIPLKKALDDCIVALYQNGEPLMPGNGFPIRLVVPGWEGNVQTKFLRRIELTSEPAMSYYESQIYTAPLPDGRAYQFYWINDVKSFITYPSYGFKMGKPGPYEISGLAYSGNGKIARVMVSADGGKTWGKAALQEPISSKAFTRFRMPWRWNGGPAVLQSRAYDEHGNYQPTRAEFVAKRGQFQAVPDIKAFQNHHFNAIMSWSIDASGEVKHVYA